MNIEDRNEHDRFYSVVWTQDLQDELTKLNNKFYLDDEEEKREKELVALKPYPADNNEPYDIDDLPF